MTKSKSPSSVIEITTETSPASTQSEVESIIEVARACTVEMSQMPLPTRLKYLKLLRHNIVSRQREISETIARATGKVVTEALVTEVMVVVDAILHAEKRTPKALASRRVKTPITFIGKNSYLEYKPRGVVVVISPWNFPFMLAVIPAIEAFAAGNCVIVKPSEETPEVGRLIESLFDELTLPSGALSVVHGGRETGEALIDAQPDFVHFTGSVETGRAIAMVTGPALIPTTLELGGKDPMIVFDDANIDRAVNGAIWGAFSNAGQVCMSVERLYVQEGIYDLFLERLIAETSKIKIGTSDGDDVGHMTTKRQLDTVARHVNDALSKGAMLVFGERPEAWSENSLSISPIILTQVDHQMDIMREETFGPVLPVMPFTDEDEAVELANDSRFGLNSSVWTSDSAKGKKVISRLRTGAALLNDVILTIGNPYLPYGGAKDSGVGSYHSDRAMQNFSVECSVMVDRGKKLREVNWFPYSDKGEIFADLLDSYWGERKNLVKFGTSYLKLLAKSRK